MKSLTERLLSLKGKFHIDVSRRPPCTKIDPTTGLKLGPPYFDLLPTELILQIASYLPVPSAAALAVCSHDFFGILAKPYITSLIVPTPDLEDPVTTDMKAHEKVLFLRTISAKSLNTFVCYRCLRIHNILKQCEDSLTVKSRFTRITDGHCVLSNALKRDTLGLCHLEVAKKLYQNNLKLDAMRYLKLASPASSKLTIFAMRAPGLNFWEAFFIHDRIYSRTQYWLNVVEDIQFRKAGRKLFFTVCEHKNSRNDEDEMLNDGISQVSRYASFGFYVSLFLRCNRCPTEICVGLKRVHGFNNRLSLVITKWQYTEASASLAPKPQDSVTTLDGSTSNPTWNVFRAKPKLREPEFEFPIKQRFERRTKTPFAKICTVRQAWKSMERSSDHQLLWNFGV
ncbi:hypothetical protein G7Y79_00042g078570 [Physcia stellaris]|nr:hypothetical protein G7Y79_00042g078570 [Physcia stellaris]